MTDAEKNRVDRIRWARLISAYSDVFKRAGFDDHDIDFSDVHPDVIEAMAEGILALEGKCGGHGMLPQFKK